MNTHSKHIDILIIASYLILVIAVWIGIFSLPSPAVVHVFGDREAQSEAKAIELDLRGADFADTVYVIWDH